MKFKISKDMNKAMEYAVYVMIGDEFIKLSCNSTWKERGLHVNFNELHEKKQYAVEDICIDYVDVLKKALPKELWNDNAEVFFVDGNSNVPEVWFVTDKYMLKIFCPYRGKKTGIHHELLAKAA